MARGWESNAVEEQQSQADQAVTPEQKEQLARERAVRLRKIQALNLTRARICEQIGRTTQDRYKQLLETELKHIEQELSGIES